MRTPAVRFCWCAESGGERAFGITIEYPLYLESGPRRKTTMVHVIDLLGCTQRGATTEAALEATPEAIQGFREYLASRGEAIDTQAEFSVRVEQHITEGRRLGYGDPAPGFSPDFEPLQPEDLEIYHRRLGWLHADLLVYAAELPCFICQAKPERERAIRRSLQRAGAAEATYLRRQVGVVLGHKEALKQIEASPEGLAPGLAELFDASEKRLEKLNPDELNRLTPHGQVTWSARRMMRRLLEHARERLLEIQGLAG